MPDSDVEFYLTLTEIEVGDNPSGAAAARFFKAAFPILDKWAQEEFERGPDTFPEATTKVLYTTGFMLMAYSLSKDAPLTEIAEELSKAFHDGIMFLATAAEKERSGS